MFTYRKIGGIHYLALLGMQIAFCIPKRNRVYISAALRGFAQGVTIGIGGAALILGSVALFV